MNCCISNNYLLISLQDILQQHVAMLASFVLLPYVDLIIYLWLFPDTFLVLPFSQDATNYADLLKKNAEAKASKDLEEWQGSMELLETKRMEMDVESQVILEAQSGMETAIDHLVEDDKREMEKLTSKGDALAKELADLLELVRLKELEIAKNDAKIQDVEERISNVVSEFHGTQSSIKTRLDKLQAAQSRLDSEIEKLDVKKKEIDDFVFASEERRLKLAEIASAATNEAKACQDVMENWKNMVALIMQHRKDRTHFAELEEKMSQEIQLLRQRVADARANLQVRSNSSLVFYFFSACFVSFFYIFNCVTDN
jgi:chromosome segregation ATPase